MLGFIFFKIWEWITGNGNVDCSFPKRLQFIDSAIKTSSSEDREKFGFRNRHAIKSCKVSTNDHPFISQINVPGIVTSSNEIIGTGTIDGETTFSRSVLADIRGDFPAAGASVLVDRERQSRLEPWKIVRLTIVASNMGSWSNEEIWEDLEDPSKKLSDSQKVSVIDELPSYRKEIGMVTGLRYDRAIFNDNFEFPTDKCSDGYSIERGDWVVLEFDADALAKKERVVSLVSPLRSLDFEGEVSFANRGYGFINKKIKFRMQAISDKSYTPQRGDIVCGVAIESVQSRDINFRAIKVFQKTALNNASSSTCIPLNLRLSQGLHSMEEYQEASSVDIEIVPSSLDFGRLSLGSSREIRSVLRNVSSGATVVALTGLDVVSLDNDQFEIISSSMDGCKGEYLLEVGGEMTFTVKATGRYPGRDFQTIVVNSSSWKVAVPVSCIIFDPMEEVVQPGLGRGRGLLNNLRGGSARGSNSRVPQTTAKFVMPGVKPMHVALQTFNYVPCKLKQFRIPQQLKNIVIEKEDLTAWEPCLGKPLEWISYTRRFSTLVHLEEFENELSMQEFDLVGVSLQRRGEFFALEVKGLSEGRPSLLVGDKVCLRLSSVENASATGRSYAGGHSDIENEGFVHEIHSEEVLVKFHPSFHASYNGQLYDTSFNYSRTPYRRMQQSIEVAHRLGREVLFPAKLVTRPSQCARLNTTTGRRGVASSNTLRSEEQDSRGALVLHNQRLNSRQQAAVVRILHGYSRPTPYLLFGPPGTGKTVTLVEAILQVYEQVPSSRVLVCAPSNSAADLLCLRLHQSGVLQPAEMVRLNAFRRALLGATVGEEAMPLEVIPYALGPDKVSEAAMRRIVVSTCVSSGMLYTLGLSAGHFTHAFVDEAGQATEAECLIPLCLAAASNGQVILAGDPKQLGPVVMSKAAGQYGLCDSLLHRLMTTSPLYQRQVDVFPASTGHYDPLVLTKLINNYRSHPGLLELPSQLFYNSELIPCAPRDLIGGCERWRGLVCNSNDVEGCPENDLGREQVPLLVHGVRGEETREGNSPSWMNASEAVLILRYTAMLLQEGGDLRLTPSDIGIITPYRKQVEKIRQLLRSGLGVSSSQLKIGSVEEFQGQERRAVLISTVRTRSLLEETGRSSLAGGLGFLSNPGRFNVSMTRGQALVVLVGDPHLLARDSNWRQLVRYSLIKGCYTGCDLTGVADYLV